MTNNKEQLNELALFAGAGGGILGGHLLGWRTVCAVEWGEYPASILCARQNDGILPPFPIWDDVQTFDGRPWRGRVDVVSGGFPCQDISTAGKGAGIDGERSGMWYHMARIIGEVRPRYAFIENSPALAFRGLDRVLADLAAIGYHARWDVISAEDLGAPHRRDRMWIVAIDGQELADADMQRDGWRDGSDKCAAEESRRRHNNESGSRSDCGWQPNASEDGEMADADSIWEPQPQGRQRYKRRRASDCSWWQTEPDVGRVANGVAARVDRLKAIGNGQVPAVAAAAFAYLKNDLLKSL